MRCHGCDAVTEIAPGEPVGFRDECAGCGRDLHVCRNCAHHDPAAYNECREPQAERVNDRERANRCDWFRAGEGPDGSGAADPRGDAKAALDALFEKS